jgi:hypothetical protein
MPIQGSVTGLMRGVADCATFDQMFEGDTPCQHTTHLMLIDAQAGAEPVKRLDDVRGALLGQQIDVEIEMIPAVSDHAEAVLLHQHEGCKQNRFQ